LLSLLRNDPGTTEMKKVNLTIPGEGRDLLNRIHGKLQGGGLIAHPTSGLQGSRMRPVIGAQVDHGQWFPKLNPQGPGEPDSPPQTTLQIRKKRGRRGANLSLLWLTKAKDLGSVAHDASHLFQTRVIGEVIPARKLLGETALHPIALFPLHLN
jgi:hypothetical protein